MMEVGIFVLVFVILFLLYLFLQHRIKISEKYRGYLKATGEGAFSQQDDVFTISGRLDQNQQWPTHDGRLSIHHLSMAELNKPPGYNDAPPSYEEAMRMAIDNSIETAREHQHQQQPESSSNQTTTTPATAATTTVTTPASTSVTIEVTGGS